MFRSLLYAVGCTVTLCMMSMFIYFWNGIIFIWLVAAAVDAASAGGWGSGSGDDGYALANTTLFSYMFNITTHTDRIQFNSVPFVAYT